jgi:ABC-type uncharacterized transport system auxiliary subunit
MNTKAAATTLVLAVICCGCVAARPSRYYQLTVPGQMSVARVESRYPATLLVAPLTASHLYREDRIVYSVGNEMGTYQYQRWAEPPTELFEDLLIRKLRDSGRYQGVYRQTSAAQGDYVLHGHLYDFREVSGGNLSATVTVELELRDVKTGSTVWTEFYTHDEPVERKKDVSAVIAALDRNAQQGISEFAASLDKYFAAHAAK